LTSRAAEGKQRRRKIVVNMDFDGFIQVQDKIISEDNPSD